MLGSDIEASAGIGIEGDIDRDVASQPSSGG